VEIGGVTDGGLREEEGQARRPVLQAQ